MAGKNYNDRILAAEVRTLALDKVLSVLKKGKGRLYEQILLRMSPNLLPRLNVLSSDEDRPLIIQLSQETAQKYGVKRSTSEYNK